MLKAGEGIPFNQNISKGQLLGPTISKADKKLNGSCLVIQQKTNLLSQKQHRGTLQHPQKELSNSRFETNQRNVESFSLNWKF